MQIHALWFRKFASATVIAIVVMSAIQINTCQEDDGHITLRCAVGRISTFNPLLDDTESQRVLRLIYDGATTHDPDTGTILPYIAVGSVTDNFEYGEITWLDCRIGKFDYTPANSWAESDKPEIIIFYDFEDVRWHDGHQMDVRDILFNFHAWATQQYSWLGHPLKDLAGGSGSNYSQTQWLAVQEVWSSEDGLRSALRFTLQEPRFSVFEYYLSAPLLPYHIWGGRASGQSVDGAKIWYDQGYDVENETFWQPSAARGWTNPRPIGSGPFTWNGSDMSQITLRSWGGHFYGPGFKYDSTLFPAVRPIIEELSLIYYSYEEKAMMDLEAGNIDMVAWEMPQSATYRFAGNPDIQIHSLMGARPVNLVFNMDRNSFGYASGQDDSGKPLRIAIAHCVNTTEIESIVRLSMANQSKSLFGNWQNRSAPRYAHDPGEAVTILSKAGYGLRDPTSPPGPENTWLNPDGTSIGNSPEGRIEMLLPNHDQDSLTYRVGTALANQLRQIGIDTILLSMDTDTLWERIFDGDFDMCLVQQGFRTRSLAPSPIGGGGGSVGNTPPSSPSAPTPFDGETEVDTYRPTMSVRVFDPDGDTMSVKFYWTETNILIGSNHEVRSGETVSVEAPILESMKTYSWYVTAQDHQHMVVSPVWTFTTERGFSRSGDPITAENHEPVPGTRSKLGSFTVGRQLPRIYSRRPENYYFSNFHTDSIDAGMNYCKYRNSSHDMLVEASMFPPDTGTEKIKVGDALASINYDIPMLELYHPTMAEVARTDRFTGFLDDGSGSLLNPHSMAHLRIQEKKRLVARFISMPMTATENTTLPFRISVTDNLGNPMAGVSVFIEHTSGNLSPEWGSTNQIGLFYAEFTTPVVPPDMDAGMQVMISLASATLDGYKDADSRYIALLVYPRWAAPLSVSAIPVLDVVESGGFTELDILVTDTSNLPVSSASISLDIKGTALVPESPWAITDRDGLARIRLDAIHTSSSEECLITVTASKLAYLNGSSQVSVMVLQPPPPPLSSESRAPLLVFLAISVLVTVIAVIHARRVRPSR